MGVLLVSAPCRKTWWSEEAAGAKSTKKHGKHILPVNLVFPMQVAIVAADDIANILPQPVKTRYSSLTGWAPLGQVLSEKHGSDKSALTQALHIPRIIERSCVSSAARGSVP